MSTQGLIPRYMYIICTLYLPCYHVSSTKFYYYQEIDRQYYCIPRDTVLT